MGPSSWLVVATFVATIAALLKYQSSPARVFGVVLVFLLLSGQVDQKQLLASIANPGLITLVLLMLCSVALEKTRLLRMIASRVIRPGYTSTWFRLFGSISLSSALLNNTAVVATMLNPVRNNPYHPAGRLLLPLSYAAILGGTLTLVGTSTNLVVDSLLRDTTGEGLNFFDFTIIGAALVVCCGGLLFVLSRWLPKTDLRGDNFHDYFVDAEVDADSRLIGRSIEEAGLRHLESLFLVEVVRAGQLISPVAPSERIQAGDRLIFSGDVSKVMQLNQFHGLTLFADANGLLGTNLSEVVIRPDSVLVGQTLKKAGFRALFDAAVVAIRRDGERVSGKLGEVVLKAGDFLVLAVGQDYSSRHNLDKNFIQLSGVEPDSRLSGWREWFAVAGFVLTIGLSAFGVIELLVGLAVLLGIQVLTGTVSANDIRRRFPMEIWLIVSTALMMSFALIDSGLVQSLSTKIDGALSEEHLFALLALVFFMTVLLTELVTNNAAAALVFPIAYSVASGLGVNPMPFVMAVAFGASASFVSPYGYQTNLMVFNAGQYRFSDFIRIGLPISLLYALVVLTLLPVVYPFG
ncbi:SLC13 family permease [Ferrimonas balearica]|uniref:SLC13 family permease n=1 Tax=Ferrimonas balearica TaxID=44012 RepID=UPI001C99B95F|nr:SLC13 family permease [Ferrimonas balearica]MBY5921245.1 SLC13 family permease [Ferrimonas balearica]MBY5996070.1 SLC13 family permease [Ferrimonas balearica]